LRVNFQATEFEFRKRAWFIAAIFCVGFWVYAFDHTNLSVAIARVILHHPDENSSRFGHYVTGAFAFGTLLVTVAALIRSWAESYLHSSIVFDTALHGEQLVADGPFRYVRNPLYLGNLFLGAGIGFLASRTGFLVLCLGMFVFVYRLILREESTLLHSQGERYSRYLAAVPRLLPSLSPRLPSGGAKPNWIDGFSGEGFMWVTVAATAVFAVTRNVRYYVWVALGLGFGAYFLRDFLRRRHKAVA
jgi:protein-S-isoprenylcysteine O-methyltransferase Ste14